MSYLQYFSQNDDGDPVKLHIDKKKLHINILMSQIEINKSYINLTILHANRHMIKLHLTT